MDFKKAKCIELHDANITYGIEDWRIGRSSTMLRMAYKVSLGDVAMIGSALGLNMNDYVNVPSLSDQLLAFSSGAGEVQSVDIPIYKAIHDIEEEDIIEILCQVVSSDLVNIRLTIENTENKDRYIESITYSGAYTIWWAEETCKPSDD